MRAPATSQTVRFPADHEGSDSPRDVYVYCTLSPSGPGSADQMALESYSNSYTPARRFDTYTLIVLVVLHKGLVTGAIN